MMLDYHFPAGTFDATHTCYADPKNATQMNSYEMK